MGKISITNFMTVMVSKVEMVCEYVYLWDKLLQPVPVVLDSLCEAVDWDPFVEQMARSNLLALLNYRRLSS